MHRLMTLALTALVIAACVNIAPGPTTRPVVVPTLPPITIPSVRIPSLPPLNLPSLNLPSFSLPSLPPFEIPSIPGANPEGGLCRLITAAEVGAALGGQVSVTESSDTSCSFFSSTNFATVSLRIESTDLEAAKFLLSNPRDLTVGSYPAVIGGFMGMGSILYIARGPESLVVQAVLLEANEANDQRLIQIGTTAASRW